MIFVATKADRLLAPSAPPSLWSRLQFVGAFLAVVLFDALLLYALLRLSPAPQDLNAETPAETMVEIVPAPPEPPPEAPAPEKKPDLRRDTPTMDEKPAVDAPREANDEKTKREDAQKKTTAPQKAAPSKQADAKPQVEKSLKPQEAKAPPPTAPLQLSETGEETLKPQDKKPDEKPAPDELEPLKPTSPKDEKAQPKIDAKTMERMAATFAAPAPEYQLGSAAKRAPVSGGNANPTYFSILYGMIVPKMVMPKEAPTVLRTTGIIVFYLDKDGRLIYQEVQNTSGSRALDAAALAAVKKAAPYPPPPTGTAIKLNFSYENK